MIFAIFVTGCEIRRLGIIHFLHVFVYVSQTQSE